MIKLLSPNPFSGSMDEAGIEHYPAWIKSLVWLSVIILSLLFWTAVFALFYAL